MDARLGPTDVFQLASERPRLWFIPTVVLTAAAIGYVLVKPGYWEASQALIIRHEAAGFERHDGQFADVAEMKTVQATILELVRSRKVMQAALRAVGPPQGASTDGNWPTEQEIADLRDRLKMAPPKGAEFGTTEVFYLTVRDQSRPRAVALVDAIYENLQLRSKELRDAKSRSLVDELARAEALAEAELAEATQRLMTFETQIGTDLAELRILHTSPAGNSDIRQELVAMEDDLRRTKAAQRRDEQLLEVLRVGTRDPRQLVATPDSLLTSQPALRRLKEGLVDAQLRTAQLAGTMRSTHPLVRAARDAEAATRGDLHNELAVAIQGVEIDLKLNSDRVATLERDLAERRQRLARLAGVRAEYANLVASSQNRGELLETTRRKLAETRARQAAARTTSLIARIDVPDGGIHPVGLRKSLIVLAGAAGGLTIGFGLAFLAATPPVPEPQRDNPRESAPRSRAVGATERRPSTAPVPSCSKALRTLVCSAPGTNGSVPGSNGSARPLQPRDPRS